LLTQLKPKIIQNIPKPKLSQDRNLRLGAIATTRARRDTKSFKAKIAMREEPGSGSERKNETKNERDRE